MYEVRDVKFLKTSLAVNAEIFHLDVKNEEILKRNLKISHHSYIKLVLTYKILMDGMFNGYRPKKALLQNKTHNHAVKLKVYKA